jgi:hypothetical protein
MLKPHGARDDQGKGNPFHPEGDRAAADVRIEVLTR